MAQRTVPNWVDLASSDVAASADFYRRVLGWQVDVSPDPQFGGYAMASLDGRTAAGIGPRMSPDAPVAWSLYIGTDDAGALGERVAAAGGAVVAPAFDVATMGRMAVFRDPAGAFISAWQPGEMSGFETGFAGAYGWAELNARNVTADLPFYQQVFGWTSRTSPMGEGQPDYTEFLLDGASIAGAWELSPGLPPEVPSYWQVYFSTDDVDAAYARALEAGGAEMVAPQAFPGGRFAILRDPQGAMFGLLTLGA